MATGEAVMPSGGADSKEATAMATADAMVHDVTGIDAPTEKQTQEGDGTKTLTKLYVVDLFEFSVDMNVTNFHHSWFVHVSCQQRRHCVSCVMTARWRSGATTVSSGCAHNASDVI